MQLSAIDLAVLILYLIGVTAVGWVFGRRQKDIRDYFLSDKSVPWWAVAASIVATETSTATFISVPAFAFVANARGEGGNLTFLQLVTGYMIGRLAVVVLFIPQYFRGELFTVYQLLDKRFGGSTKRIAATLFLVTRSLADGIRLYATAIVIVALTGWSDLAAILVVGVVTMLYTYLGGMSAVVWTDVVQFVIYIVGAIIAAWLLLLQIPGGWEGALQVADAAGNFRVFDFTSSLSRSYTFWSGILGGAFLATATHGTDQLMVQRYLCSRGPAQAARALVVSSGIVYLQFVLFLLIGVMLFVFYGPTGAAALPADIASRPDRIFPFFIVTQLPAGVVGLLIAAILAAAMSTLSSSLNSSAATALTDFYRPLMAPRRSEGHYLTVSRGLTMVWGIIQIFVAIGATQTNQRIVDSVLSIASFTSGPVLGLFFLGTLSRRAGTNGALAGVLSGILFVSIVWLKFTVSWQWYTLIGATVTLTVGSLWPEKSVAHLNSES